MNLCHNIIATDCTDSQNGIACMIIPIASGMITCYKNNNSTTRLTTYILSPTLSSPSALKIIDLPTMNKHLLEV